MKRITALLLSLMLALPLFSLGAAAEGDGAKGFKVYPFEAFITNSGKLDMTPDGAYTLSRNDAVSETSGFISFFVSNLFNNVDYNAMDNLYLYTGDSLMDFTVKAEFHNSLDGYFYPSVEIYQSNEETKAGSTIKIPYKETLEAAGKWSPDKKILSISIQFFHDNDASKKLSFRSIWLGGDSISTQEDDSRATGAFDFTEPTDIGNITFTPVSDAANRCVFTLNKERTQAEGFILKDLPQGSRITTPYVYINVSQLAPHTWPYFYFKNPDSIMTGEAPNPLRIRPEMVGSNIWLRVDLRESVSGTGARILKSENLTLRCHISVMSSGNEPPVGPVTFGVYYGGEVFKLGDTNPPEETDADRENAGNAGGTVITQAPNQPVIPGGATKAPTNPASDGASPSVTAPSKQNGAFNWWLVIVPAIVVVLAGGGIGVYFWAKKKNKS